MRVHNVSQLRYGRCGMTTEVTDYSETQGALLKLGALVITS